MKTRPFFHFLLLAVLLTACGPAPKPPTPTPTPEPEVEASVIDFVNLVEAHAQIPDPWQPAAVGMRIFPGGEVWAREASTARLGLGESTIRVAPNTIFTLSRPDDQTLQLDLDEGQIWLNVEGLAPGEEFKIETPGATASVRGTRFGVQVKPDGTTVVSVVEGEVALETGAGQTVVGAGTQSSARAGELPSDPIPNTREQQLLWGNAQGAALDILIPATGQETCLDPFQGVVSGPPVYNPGGTEVTYRRYDPSAKKYEAIFTTVSLPDGTAGDRPPNAADAAKHGQSYNPAGDRILYTIYEKKSLICTADPDGQNTACFDTGDAGTDVHFTYPQWSPDGQRVLFNAEYYTQMQSAVYSANPDGSGLARLTPPDSGYNTSGTWSPDGRQIAFVRSTGLKDIHEAFEKQDNQLWVANRDGSDPRMLADTLVGLPGIAWSPNGQWMAVPTTQGIGLFDPAGEAQTIRDTGGTNHNLQWSPSGSGWPLTFLAVGADTGIRDLYTVSNPARPPDLLLADIFAGPYWSPDGGTALIARRETVDADKKIYQTSVCFLTFVSGLWP